MRIRMFSVRRSFMLICLVGCAIFVSDLTGAHRHFFEKSFQKEFSYPLDLGSDDFLSLVRRYRNHEIVSYDPLNQIALNLQYLYKADGGCSSSDTYRLVILVKSEPENFERRKAIRDTWGYPKRFSDVPIKTIFLLGTLPSGADDEERSSSATYEEDLHKESQEFGDILQGDFEDNEYNSTTKTLMGLRWLTETCSQFRFALVTSDDMYISIRNLLKFVHHPVEYPNYWERQKELDNSRLQSSHRTRITRAILANEKSIKEPLGKPMMWEGKDKEDDNNKKHSVQKNDAPSQWPIPKPKGPTKVWKNSPVDFDIDLAENTVLYAGNVIQGKTHRHKLGTKYYLTLDEYPFDRLPPFVTSEAIVLSKPAVLDIYYASFFTKFLHIDDIYLGLCAKKMSIDPFHSTYFHLDPSFLHNPNGIKDVKYVIAANNFDDPNILREFWNRQKSLGNA